MEALENHTGATARHLWSKRFPLIVSGVLSPLTLLVIDDGSLHVPVFLGMFSAVVLLVIIFSLPSALPLIAKYRRPHGDLYRAQGWDRINVVARNWYGETPLWLSFWLAFIGGSILLVAITNFFDGALDLALSISPNLVLICEVSLFLLFWSVWIWQMVGVLRSADRYKAVRTGRNKKTYWGTLAQIIVVVVTLGRAAVSLNSGMAHLVDTLRVVLRDDPSLPAYSIQLSADGTQVEIDGGIKFGLADDLAKILNSQDIRVVRLNSLGGRLREAEKLFSLVRERRLTTYVSGECFSACTIVFAGGRERVIDQGAILGFHRGAFASISEKDADRIERGVYATVGFDDKFISRILATPHTDIWKPSLQELLAANVITAISDKP